ncbi:MAG: ThiF family adenylyltransferase [Acidobacteria bacterium]|nr:ThiF family adenylyltransferase [Acidobacteriota bacterium]MBI3657390.1 ThiF family adenylyltransferase [Acidobacteriota bacterium]
MRSERYSRQILFPGISEPGQEELLKATAVIVGCGALGTVQAESLVRAGVGHVRIIDRDFVEESNLQRQTLFDEADARAGLPKAIAAERRLRQINSSVRVEGIIEDVNPTNILELIAGARIILDATDNFETRFLINDASVKTTIPWIYGACVGSYGLTMTIVPGETPCLRCLFQSAPPLGASPTCDTAGVIAPIVNMIASLQVTEALKLLVGKFEKRHGKLINLDVWDWRLTAIDLTMARRLDCATCAHHEFEYLHGKATGAGMVLCGRNSVQINRAAGQSTDFAQLAERLQSLGEVMYNDFLFKFKTDLYEIAVFADGRGIIKGTKEIGVAKTVFNKYIGG